MYMCVCDVTTGQAESPTTNTIIQYLDEAQPDQREDERDGQGRRGGVAGGGGRVGKEGPAEEEDGAATHVH